MDRRKFLQMLGLSAAGCVAFPGIAFASDSDADAVREPFSAFGLMGDVGRDAAVLELLTGSLKAGVAAKNLETTTKGALKVDFANLEQPPNDQAWIVDALEYVDGLVSATPQILADDAQDGALMDAQGSAVDYAVRLALWSVSEGRSSDLSSEAVYMYMSHYVDVGSNYWSAGSLEYLLDGERKSNTEPFLSQWLQKADRDAYATYLSTTSGTKQLAKIGDIAAGMLGLKGTATEVRAAAESVNRLAYAGNVCKATFASLSTAYDAGTMANDLAEFMDVVSVDRSNDPYRKVSQLKKDYLENNNVFSKYDEMAKDQLIGIGLGVLAGGALAGGPVGALGAAAVGIVSSAATISLYMASDIYSYVAWVGMRYGWSTRYSMRLYEKLFG